VHADTILYMQINTALKSIFNQFLKQFFFSQIPHSQKGHSHNHSAAAVEAAAAATTVAVEAAATTTAASR